MRKRCRNCLRHGNATQIIPGRLHGFGGATGRQLIDTPQAGKDALTHGAPDSPVFDKLKVLVAANAFDPEKHPRSVIVLF